MKKLIPILAILLSFLVACSSSPSNESNTKVSHEGWFPDSINRKTFKLVKSDRAAATTDDVYYFTANDDKVVFDAFTNNADPTMPKASSEEYTVAISIKDNVVTAKTTEEGSSYTFEINVEDLSNITANVTQTDSDGNSSSFSCTATEVEKSVSDWPLSISTMQGISNNKSTCVRLVMTPAYFYFILYSDNGKYTNTKDAVSYMYSVSDFKTIENGFELSVDESASVSLKKFSFTKQGDDYKVIVNKGLGEGNEDDFTYTVKDTTDFKASDIISLATHPFS